VPLAVLLAGGRGTRLRPFTYYRPKPLMPVANRPVIDYVLELLERSRVARRALVLLDYKGEMVRRYLEGRDSELEVEPLVYESLDTADAVRRVKNLIDDDFVAVMCDIVTNCDLQGMWRTHVARQALATIALHDVERPHQFGLAVLGSDGKIAFFMEKPRTYELYVVSLMMRWREASLPHANLANMGIYAFRHEVLDIMDENPHLMDFGRHVFPFLVENGYPVYGWHAGECYWIDIGVPQSYLQANMDVMTGMALPLKPRGVRSLGVWADSGAVMGGTVHPPAVLGAGARVEPGARVGPFAVLGDGTTVEGGAVVRDSVLLEGVTVEGQAVVEHSIVGGGVTIPAGAKVVMSLVEDGVPVVDRVVVSRVVAKAVAP